ncbi:MAG TPA: hypothetical protein VIV11_18240 [Kofleriaceae bacterium]
MRGALSIAIVLVLARVAVAEEPKPDAPKPTDTTVDTRPVDTKPAPKPAEPKPTEPKPENPFDAYSGANTRARELFDAAKQQLRDGNQAGACTKFGESYKQEEATSTQLNLARCRENEGKHAEAWRMFQDAAERARSSGFEDRAKVALGAATALEERLATVVIRLAAPIAPGTVVTVNDRIVDTAPEVRELVDPGTVLVTAKGPTGVTSTKTFRTFVKTTFKVDVPTLQEREAGRKPAWIALSAVAVVGGAIALGAGSGAVRLVGGAVMAGGVALFLLAPRERTMVVPMLVSNESGTGIALGGRF